MRYPIRLLRPVEGTRAACLQLDELGRLLPLGQAALCVVVVWLPGFLNAVEHPAIGTHERKPAGCPDVLRDASSIVRGCVRVWRCVSDVSRERRRTVRGAVVERSTGMAWDDRVVQDRRVLGT